MKKIDNRQKQQAQLRAQKAPSGLHPPATSHDTPHAPEAKEEKVETDMKPIHREAPKIGRNDPCSCGSGKKYKKCCGK